MPLDDSTILGTADFGRDVFDARLRGFFTAFRVLRLALSAGLTLLPFVLLLAIVPPLGCSR